MRGLWLVVALAACNEKPTQHQRQQQSPPSTPPRPPTVERRDSDSLTPQPFHEQAEGGTKPAEAIVKKYRVTWANVISTPPSCWFFSGPNGRDTPLGEHIVVRTESGHAWATWSNATFEGTWGESAIDVLRLATHRYQGTWVISERLQGQMKEKGIHAKYTYDECHEGTKCPGECRITADVLLVEE